MDTTTQIDTPADPPATLEEVFAAKVAAGCDMAEAGAAVGIQRRQAYRWLERPEVAKLVDQYRRQAIDAALGRLSDCGTLAVDTLSDALSDPNVGNRERIQAACRLLGAIERIDDNRRKDRDVITPERMFELIQKLLDSVQTEIKDAEAKQRIAASFSLAMASHGINRRTGDNKS